MRARGDGETSSTLRRRVELALAPDARIWPILGFAAVVIGCAVRLFRFVDSPALWLDEAFLAINLMDKSLSDVLGPLEFQQSAPPGFLIVEKGAELLLGDAERSLRLFPFVASLASVILVAYCARRLLSPPAAALAIVLFATGEPLLERAAEVKPYSVDVAVAALLTALTLWVLEAPRGATAVRAAILGGVGLVSLWFSFPAVLTLAAAIVAIVIHGLRVGSRRLVVGAVVLGGLAIAMFAAVYAVASSNVTTISAAIFGGSASSTVERFKVVQELWSVLDNPGAFQNGTAALAALLVCFGIVALAWQRSFDRLALITLPSLFAVAAHLLDRYPLGGRFSLFLVPSLLILVARGAQATTAWSRRPVLVGAGLTVFLITSPLALAAYHVLEPPAREDVRPVLSHLVREWQDGDSLYVYPESQYALRYYATCDDCAPSGAEFPWPIRIPPPTPQNPAAPALESVPPALIVGSTAAVVDPYVELERLPRAGRVWLLFSHVGSHNGIDPESVFVTELGRERQPVEAVRARGANLYLFDRMAVDGPG